MEECNIVQSAGIRAFKKLSQQLKMAFLPLLSGADICREHLHLQYYFPPVIFLHFVHRGLRRWGISESVQAQMMVYP